MVRLILLLSLLLLVAVFTARLIAGDMPITATLGDYEITTSLVVLLALLLCILLLFQLAVGLLGLLVHAPARLLRLQEERRYKHGMDEITHTLTAIAVGDAAKAKRHLAKTTRALPRTPLVHILSAQIAGIERNQDALKLSLEALLEHKSTTPLAHRGLAELHLRQGNVPHAIYYAQHALKADPYNKQTGLNLLSLHVRDRAWDKAYALLRDRALRRTLTRAARRLAHAKLALAEAQYLAAHNDPHGALERAEIAHHLAPHFLPASLELIDLYVTHKRLDTANKRLVAAWKERPHPDLAALAFTLPGDDIDREKRVARLARTYPHHLETHLMEGKSALLSQQFSAARNHLQRALECARTPRGYALMAELELREFQDEQSRNDWLTKSASLAKEPVWKCTECGHETTGWTLHCTRCDAYDTVEWR